MKVRICNFEGCTKKHKAKGYCITHYTRLAKYGDASITNTPGPKPGTGRAVVEYRAMHMRLETQRGKARWYNCENCNNKAADWAMYPFAPNQLVSSEPGHEGLSYSLEIRYYRPLCRVCHRDERTGVEG